VQAALQANGTWIYIEGAASTKPTTATELKDWHTTNDCIVGALCGIIDDALLQDLEKFNTAKETWTHLKMKTHQGGIIAKLTALQAAIQALFTSTTSIIMTIAEIKDLITTVYDEGAPTQEEWTTVILLQALADGKFEWLHKQFITTLTNQSSQLTSNDIIKCLEAEAQEACANDS